MEYILKLGLASMVIYSVFLIFIYATGLFVYGRRFERWKARYPYEFLLLPLLGYPIVIALFWILVLVAPDIAENILEWYRDLLG